MAWAAATLTRPEAVLVFAVFWAATALAARLEPAADEPGPSRPRPGRWPVGRALLLDGVVVTAVVLGHLVFRYLAYDGELLPNTYHAKADGFRGMAPWFSKAGDRTCMGEGANPIV